MKSLVEGSKYFVFSAKGFHWVSPFLVLSSISRHSKLVPYGLVLNPRCVLYHSLTAFGSLHLKKMPPIPVTFFIFVFFLLDIIVLKAKPNRNEVAISVIVNNILFIVNKINFLLLFFLRLMN